METCTIKEMQIIEGISINLSCHSIAFVRVGTFVF